MAEHAQSAEHTHIIPPRTYVLIYVVLLVCTYLTWQVAYFDLGALNTVAALAIAVFKAVLVVLFFMHVKYSSRLTWIVVASGVFWLGIMLALTFGDYLFRGWRTYGLFFTF
jgi:cytochrome c oxidase subunit IV